MATLIKTWSFPTDSEGWTLSLSTWDAGGYITTDAVGRNTRVDSSATLTTTYGALGIPSGASITNIQVSLDHRCANFNVSDGANWFFDIDSVSYLAPWEYTGTTAWATANGTTLNVTKTDTDTITLYHDSYADNGNNASARTTVDVDNIVLTITYTEATYDFSGSVSSSAASDVAINSNKDISATIPTQSTTTSNTLTYNKVEITYDFSGSVTESSISNVSINHSKQIATSIALSTTTNNVLVYSKSEGNFDFSGIVNVSATSDIIIVKSKTISTTIGLSTTTSIPTYTYEVVTESGTSIIISSTFTISAIAAKATTTSFAVNAIGNVRMTRPPTSVSLVYRSAKRPVYRGPGQEQQVYFRNNIRGR